MKDYSKMTFEEYSELRYKDLLELLKGFPECKVRAFWNREQELVKKKYRDFIKRYNSNNRGILLNDGLAYGLSLMF